MKSNSKARTKSKANAPTRASATNGSQKTTLRSDRDQQRTSKILARLIDIADNINALELDLNKNQARYRELKKQIQ